MARLRESRCPPTSLPSTERRLRAAVWEALRRQILAVEQHAQSDHLVFEHVEGDGDVVRIVLVGLAPVVDFACRLKQEVYAISPSSRKGTM